MKQSFASLLLKVLSILVFVVIATLTLFFAYGYTFDVNDGVIQKTSIIDVVNRYQGVKLFMDGDYYADSLPYQIKNIVPGVHEIKVKKLGFLQWARTVMVEEDIVTIVKDVLMVPEDVNDYLEELLLLDEDVKVVYEDDFFLVYEPGERTLKMVVLFGNGTIREEDVSFFEEGFEVTDVFPGESFLLKYNDVLGRYRDDIYAFVSFEDKEFRIFALPVEVERIRVDAGRDMVFFMKDNAVYGVPFDNLDEESFEDIDSYELISVVDTFGVDYFGHVFFIADGMLYRVNYDGGEHKLLDQCPMCYMNLAFHLKNGFGLLVVRGNDESRKLFVVDNGGSLAMVTDDFKGDAFVNADNEVLYADTEGHIFKYNVDSRKKTFIQQLQEDFQLMGWFADGSHFLFQSKGQLVLADVFYANVNVLLEKYNVSKTFLVGASLFFVENNSLKRIYWEDAF